MQNSGRATVMGGGLILLAAICGGMLAGWWTFRNLDARLLLSNQPATVMLPASMPVQAKILNDLDILINSRITTQVPIDQTIKVPIRQTLHVIATLDHEVPIKMNVPVHATLPVDQVVHVDSHVQVTVLGQTLTLPVRGDIPIKTQVPLNLTIPVDQMVRLKFSAPADVQLKQALVVPLKADIATTIPIHSEMHIPVKSDLQADITVSQPIDVVITDADLKLPLHTLRLKFGDDNQAAPPAPASAESTQ